MALAMGKSQNDCVGEMSGWLWSWSNIEMAMAMAMAIGICCCGCVLEKKVSLHPKIYSVALNYLSLASTKTFLCLVFT